MADLVARRRGKVSDVRDFFGQRFYRLPAGRARETITLGLYPTEPLHRRIGERAQQCRREITIHGSSHPACETHMRGRVHTAEAGVAARDIPRSCGNDILPSPREFPFSYQRPVPTTVHTLSTFREVSAALSEPTLTLDGARGDNRPGASAHEGGRRAAVSADEIARLLPTMQRSAHALALTLPAGQPVELVGAFAEPWSRGLALASVDRSPAEGGRLLELARAVFLNAAHASSRVSATSATGEIVALAQALSALQSSLAVQSFVALAHTVPAALAGAWLVLVSEPGAWHQLRASPDQRAAAIEELLRMASPARAVFRIATADLTLGETHICAGDEVVLELQRANRCPARFPDPDRYAPERFALASERQRHVGLGLAPHACAGGALVRLAMEVATTALLEEFDEITPTGPVTWLDGRAIRAPASFSVVLRRAAQPRATSEPCA
jgi:hypothetical protein